MGLKRYTYFTWSFDPVRAPFSLASYPVLKAVLGGQACTRQTIRPRGIPMGKALTRKAVVA